MIKTPGSMRLHIVMDLNYLLEWIVGISAVSGLVRLLQARTPGRTGWIGVFAALLALLLAGMLLFPELAGYVSGVFWMLFVLAPGLILRLVQKELFRQNFARARFFAVLVKILHPADGMREYPELIQSFEVARDGRFEEAERILQKYESMPGWMGQSAGLYLRRLKGDWQGVLDWCLRIPPATMMRSADALTMYLRSLGEMGRLNEMVEVFAKFEKPLGRMPKKMRDLARLYVYSFAGRTEVVEKLFADSLSLYPAEIRTSWLGTSLLAAGRTDEGRRILEELIRTGDPITRRAIEQRLDRPLPNATQELIPPCRAILEADERVLESEARFESERANAPKPVVTYALVLACLAVFGLEVLLGGAMNERTLWKLGAMMSSLALEGQWWRIFAAQFLHYGFLHLFMNMLALYLLGPFVERELGRLRYLVLYLASGTCAMLTIVLLTTRHMLEDGFVVGASGNILGLIGGTAAILVVGWLRHRAPSARRRLASIAFILLLQATFDLMTPQVSFTAHFSGAVFGFLIALMLNAKSAKS